MVECDDRELVFLAEQVEQEALNRRPRLDKPLAKHAVAHVQQHRQGIGTRSFVNWVIVCRSPFS